MKITKIAILLLIFVSIIYFAVNFETVQEKESNTKEETEYQADYENIVPYEILTEWYPNEDPEALGLEVSIQNISEQNIINLVNYFASTKEIADIQFFNDDTEYLAHYTKNAEVNELEWMQEEGVLEELFGAKTAFYHGDCN